MFICLQEFAEAIDLAAESIELRPDNYEGYYARSKAHMELNHFEEALHDAKLAVEKSGNAGGDIQKILARLQDELTQRCLVHMAGEVTDTTDL